MKRPYFSYKFLKRIENKQWLGVGLIRCDRKTVVSSGVESKLVHFEIARVIF